MSAPRNSLAFLPHELKEIQLKRDIQVIELELKCATSALKTTIAQQDELAAKYAKACDDRDKARVAYQKSLGK